MSNPIDQSSRGKPASDQDLEPFREVLNQSPLAITVVGLDARVLMWNPEAERLFGWKAEEVIGRQPPHVPPDAFPAMMEHIRNAAEGHPLRAGEVVRLRRDGTRVNALFHTAALRDRSGRVVGIMGMFVDVTERRQIEMRLRNAQKMEAVGLLAGGVAHDFNNLLTAIKGFSALLLEAVGDNQAAHECVDEIVRASERAAGLTGQLLAFSRRQLLRPEVLDLNKRIRQMQPMLRVLAASTIELTLDLEEPIDPVLADPVQFEQVVLNLVMNARDAIEDRGRITIRTRPVTLDAEFGRWGVTPKPGPYVRLDVTDTGVGMDPLTVARAFDPFYTTKDTGTGLGLATVFGIVKQSGGYVWPATVPGKGTTFSVYLPRAKDASGLPLPAPTAASSPSVVEAEEEPHGEPRLTLVPRTPTAPSRTRAISGRTTVLVVDDEAAVRDVLRRALSRRRYTVLDAPSGEEALRVSRAFGEHIDLVITDIRMPGMTGLELRDLLVTDRPNIRVLFMSGHADEFTRRELSDANTPFLAKPFSMEGLEEAMQAAMAVVEG